MFSPSNKNLENPAILNSTLLTAIESGRFCGAPDFQFSVVGALSLATFLPLMNAAKPSSYLSRRITSSISDKLVISNGMRIYTDSVLFRIALTSSPIRLP